MFCQCCKAQTDEAGTEELCRQCYEYEKERRKRLRL